MEKSGYANFAERPRTIDDLMAPHPVEQKQAYEISKTVSLAKMDYENFITDMIADRQFLEDNAAFCSQGETWRCILVRRRGRADGVLVMPADNGHVGWAAYYHAR